MRYAVHASADWGRAVQRFGTLLLLLLSVACRPRLPSEAGVTADSYLRAAAAYDTVRLAQVADPYGYERGLALARDTPLASLFREGGDFRAKWIEQDTIRLEYTPHDRERPVLQITLWSVGGNWRVHHVGTLDHPPW